MEIVKVRQMTSEEFDRFRAHTIVEYAAAHTSVGNWSEEEAIEKSTQSINELLPDGAQTEGTLVLTALTGQGIPIGYLWIGLQRKGGLPGEAWIYDIELYEQFRGNGYGRALLTGQVALASSATFLKVSSSIPSTSPRTVISISGI